jgi:hypothetical protein
VVVFRHLGAGRLPVQEILVFHLKFIKIMAAQGCCLYEPLHFIA